MAVALEFINLIVPIALIKQKFPGGWEKCLEEHKHLLGGRVWYDDHILRDGAMNPNDMKSAVEWWEENGFQPIETKNGAKSFKDLCVVEGMFGGSTLPCDWIEFTDDYSGAYLKGTEAGDLVGRWTFKEKSHPQS